MNETVWVAEVGSGPRKAVAVQRYEEERDFWVKQDTMCSDGGLFPLPRKEMVARVVVNFTDERGGFRDCFATSVFATKEECERYLKS